MKTFVLRKSERSNCLYSCLLNLLVGSYELKTQNRPHMNLVTGLSTLDCILYMFFHFSALTNNFVLTKDEGNLKDGLATAGNDFILSCPWCIRMGDISS